MLEHYAWFIWSLLFLAVWYLIYVLKKDMRKEMLRISFYTMPFGLTEPLFVPEYWNPPSLFDLAQKTGFDIESLIFSFAIGGIGTVLYELLFRTSHVKISQAEKGHHRHRFHLFTLLSPVLIFLILAFTTSLNHLYCAMIAMFAGALAALFCRPDLKAKIWVGGLLFLGFYFIFFITLLVLFPGYVEKVWNLDNISGIIILGIPLEELIFAFTFGMIWSSFYEHIYWYKIVGENEEAHA